MQFLSRPTACMFKKTTRSITTLKKTSGTNKAKVNRSDPEYQTSILQLAHKQKAKDDSSKRKKIHWSWTGISLLVVPATTFSLGCWQVRRLKWKENLLRDIHDRMKQEIISLEEENLFEDLAYRRVRLNGIFQYDKELVIKIKRHLAKAEQRGIGGFFGENDDGFFVVTPFKLSNSGRVIMVNRGWVPTEYEDPKRRMESLIKSEVKFEGFVPPTKKKRWLLKLQDTLQPPHLRQDKEEKWHLKNINEMATLLDAEPVLVDAVKGLSIPGGPVEGELNYEPLNNHLSYLLTWYSLTALTLIMWYSKFIW